MKKLDKFAAIGKKALDQAIQKGGEVAEDVRQKTSEAGKVIAGYWGEHEADVLSARNKLMKASKDFLGTASDSAEKMVGNLYDGIKYSPSKLTELQKHIKYQGGYYRELNRNSRLTDSLFLGGESLVSLIAAASISEEVIAAYEAAYPELSMETTLSEKLGELSGDELLGLLSGIKGKLFEQQYVEYLNNGNLPDEFVATLAASPNQPVWDIKIEGPNEELVEVIQAKATDSVGYVTEALRNNPGIDVVTTEEVYSHLVMSGVSDNLLNSHISDSSLNELLDSSVDAVDIGMIWSPPWFTLALIAFTSYKDASLTLFQKARSAGDRTGKAYLAFLIGGSVASVSNTWWLGVLGTVTSRYLSDKGKQKKALFDRLRTIAKQNDTILEKLARKMSPPEELI